MEPDLLTEAPFLNTSGYDEVFDENWPAGYRVIENFLDTEQFDIIDALAENHICIDIKPAPRPSGSPLGR